MRSSRKVLLISLVSLVVGHSLAAVPTAFAATGAPRILNYQGRLMDASGTVLGGSGTNYCFRFSLYDSPVVGSGTKLWPSASPSTMTIPVKSGVFNAGIGDTSAGGDTLDYNFQDSDSVYLNVDVATMVGPTCAPGDGAEVYETLSPRQRLLSSAYTVNANTVGGFTPAQNASGAQIPVLNSGNLVLGGTNPIISASTTNALVIQGSGTGDIRFFNATNKIDSLGNLSLTGSVFVGNGLATSTLQSGLTGTSTIQGFLNVLGANSTSTFSGGLSVQSLAVTGAATSTFAKGISVSSGCFAVNGTCISTGFSTSSADYYLNASTTIPKTYASNSFTATQTFVNASTTNISASYASSTQGFFGSVVIGTLAGIVHASAGVISASALNLANEVTGFLGVTNGGTGTSTAPTAGQVLVGNALGGYDYVATSTFGGFSTTSASYYVNASTTIPKTYAANAFTSLQTFTNLIASASSTIGSGSPNGGLTISGGATTTGNTYFAGMMGIGSTSPFARLSINANNGSTNTTLFAIGSSTSNSTTTLFAVSNTGSTTIANGVNITKGCYAVNGVCINSGSGTSYGGMGTIQLSNGLSGFTTDANFAWNYGLRLLSVGDGSQTGGLSVNGGLQTTGTSYFVNLVGIGTSSPLSDLQIATSTAPTSIDTADEYFHIGGTEYGINSYRLMGFGWTGATQSAAYMGYQETTIGSYDYGDLVFGTRGVDADVAPTERMRITGSGNVGVGATSATNVTNTLTVVGPVAQDSFAPTIANAAALITNPGAVTGYTADLAFSVASGPLLGNVTSVISARRTGNGGQGALDFYTKYSTTNGVAPIVAMTMDQKQSIGIGTTSPFARLSIEGNTTDSVIANTLFAVASSTGSADNTLFSISNTGSTTAANGINITNGCFAFNGTCLTSNAGTITGLGTGYATTSSGAVTFATSTIGTDFTITGSGQQIVFTLPSASVTSRGVLTSTDWSTFNNKVSSSSLAQLFPFTPTTNFAIKTNATSTKLSLLSGMFASSTSIFDQLLIGSVDNGGLALAQTPLQISSSTNNFLQGTIHNVNSGTAASSNWIACNDKTTDCTHYYGELGINSSGYNQAIDNAENPNDVYLTSSDSSLVLGAGSTTNPIAEIRFATGGLASSSIRAKIDTQGRFGIATSSPFARLALHANPNDTTFTQMLFAIGSSTATATTTLFTISNTGSTTATNGFNITGGCYALNGSCLQSAAFSYLFPNNATTTGLGIYASTTIGSGSQIGGLTVSGGATTTGNAYFAGNVGIGTNSPTANVSLQNNYGSTNSTVFSIASSTSANGSSASSLLTVSANGSLSENINASQSLLGFNVVAPDNHYITLRPSVGSGSNGALAGAGDEQLLFSNTAVDTGVLDLMPWTTTAKGVKIVGSTGAVGINTPSPSAMLSVQNNYLSSISTLLSLASSTSNNGTTANTVFTVDNTGSTTAANGINITSGCYAMNGTCLQISGTTFSYLFPGNATSTGLMLLASTTIGNGSAGLTISGPATTTGNAYFGGSLGIGSSSPNALLTIVGTTQFPSQSFFSISTSSNASSTPFFRIASSSATIIDGGTINPTHKGSISVTAASVFVSGANAYVAAGGSLEVYNISNPANPVHIGSLANGVGGAKLSGARSVFVSGNYAYVASFTSGALEIVDVSNPANPVHKGSISDTVGGAQLSQVQSVFVSGNYAYVASFGSLAVEIIDISNPANPVHKGTISDGGGSPPLLDEPQSIYVSGNYAYVVSPLSSALEILDVSNPANPIHKGSLADGVGGAQLAYPVAVAVSGNYAYVVGTSNALEIVDVSNPANPVHKGVIVNGQGGAVLSSGTSVFVSGTNAYVTAGNALEVVDVSNPANPVHKGVIRNGVGGALLGGSNSVFVSGNNAYVAAASSNALEVVDVGGEYVSNEQVGTSNIGNLQVSNFAQFNQGVLISSGLNVGTNALINGALTISGNMSSSTFSSPSLSAGTADTNTSSIVDVANLFHTATSSTSGGANGIGTGLLFSAADSAGTATSTARIASLLVNAAHAAPSSVLTFYTKNSSGVLNEQMRLDQNGNLGVGTTSPYANLSVFASNGETNQTLFAIGSSTSLATTTLFAVSNTGSTTAANGFNIASGCFAIKGTCLSTSGSNYFSNAGVLTTLSTGSQLNVPNTGWYSLGGQTLAFASSTTGATIFGLGAGGSAATTSSFTQYNTAFGYFALSQSGINGYNTAVGYQALEFAGSGNSNAAVGYWALNSDTTGSSNAAFGYGSLAANNGNYNTAQGYNSLNANTSGINNTAVGGGALASNLVGNNNSALGNQSLGSNNGSYNIGLGTSAGGWLVNGSDNIFLGSDHSDGAGAAITTGFNDIMIGTNTMGTSSNSTNFLNIGNFIFGTLPATSSSDVIPLPITGALGIGSTTPWANFAIHLNNGEVGGPAFAIGSSTSLATTTLFVVSNTGSTTISNGVNITNGCYAVNGTCITAGGSNYFSNSGAVTTLSTGSQLNVPSGGWYSINGQTLAFSSNSNQDTLFGIGAGGQSATTSGDSTMSAFGYKALSVNAQVDNSAFGAYALTKNTSGSGNTAVGKNALQANVSGTNNTGIGSAVLFNETGSNNSAFGASALATAGTTFFNAAFGSFALTSATSDHNTAFGVAAGYTLTTGSDNVFIGSETNYVGGNNITTGSNNIMIGSNANIGTSSSSTNFLNIGNLLFGILPATTSNTALKLPTTGGIGIGSTTPWADLSVHANNGATGGAVFAIGSSTAAATTTLFVVGNNGNVGVGTSTPFATLSVNMNSTNKNQSALMVGNTGSSTPALYVGSLNQNGFVGIGTTTAPAATSTLLLVGNTGIASGRAIAQFSNAGGTCNITNLAVNCTSDLRMKKNISALTPALSTVLQLQPVTYNFNAEADGTPVHSGFIAQQVQTLTPDLVSTDDRGMLSLNYAGFSSYLVSAIKQINGAVDVTDALSGTSTIKSYYAGMSVPAIVVDAAGNLKLSGYGAGMLMTDEQGNVTVSNAIPNQLNALQSAVTMLQNVVSSKVSTSTASTTTGTGSNTASADVAVATTTATTTIGNGLHYENGTLSLDLANPNTWSGLQQFGTASTTLLESIHQFAQTIQSTSTNALVLQTNLTSTQGLTLGGTSTPQMVSLDTKNDRVTVGTGGSSNPTIFVADTGNASDPEGVNGAIYYSSTYNTFRCFENSAWRSCGGQAASSTGDVQVKNVDGSFTGTRNFNWNLAANGLVVTANVGQMTDVLTIASSTGVAMFSISSMGVLQLATTTDPSVAPPPNQLDIYAASVAGKTMVKTEDSTGSTTPLQSALFGPTIVMFAPATGTIGTGTGFGTTWTAGGAVSHPAPASTPPAIVSQMHRTKYANVAGVADQTLGVMATRLGLPQFWMGNAPGLGGFFFHARFSIEAMPSSSIRLFVGLTSSSTSMVTTDTPLGDFVGLWHDTTDGTDAFSIITRNNMTSTKTPITGATLAAGQAYDFYLYAKPNDTAVYYRLDSVNTGVSIVDSSVSATLPRNVIFMGPQVVMSNGVDNTTAATSAIGINNIYVESKY